jgi:pimeloyl-ACP methyl ester carboxylesterase
MVPCTVSPIDIGKMTYPKTLSLDGFELEFAEQGVGVPVVFVHGSNSDFRIWNDHRDAIASHCRMITITQRYFGVRPRTDDGEKFGQRHHAEDLAAFIRHLDVGPVILVGWSYGGGVCLAMTSENPDLVQRMFLFEPSVPSIVSDPADIAVLRSDGREMAGTAVAFAKSGKFAASLRAFMDGVDGQVGSFDRLPESVRKVMLENARMLPLLFATSTETSVTPRALEQLSLPVVIACGGSTRRYFEIMARCCHELLPNSELKIAEGGRHLWPLENPGSFSDMVLEFLMDGLGASG